MDISKRITPEFAIEIGDTFTALNPHDGPAVNGFGNLELGGKYQLLKNGEHEAIVSIGLGVEVGGTGCALGGRRFIQHVDARDFFWQRLWRFTRGSAVPEAVRHSQDRSALRFRLARARAVSQWTSRPANSEIDVERHPDVLEWGFALEYSLIYLQSQVQDIGLARAT